MPSLASELIDLGSDIKAYPNPAREYVTFEYRYPDDMQNVSITIVDLNGRTMKRFPVSESTGQLLWDTREVAAGQYMFMLIQGNQRLKSGRITVVK